MGPLYSVHVYWVGRRSTRQPPLIGRHSIVIVCQKTRNVYKVENNLEVENDLEVENNLEVEITAKQVLFLIYSDFQSYLYDIYLPLQETVLNIYIDLS